VKSFTSVERFSTYSNGGYLMNTSEKLAYIKPQLTEVGSFEEVTLGGSSGASLDASFPTGTPFADLTFS
jgi:hypothetical protein